jgi:hypothetical protein
MKITNKHGLPEAFLSFVRDSKYDKGQSDISVTTLIDAPRVNILKQQRREEIEMDVVDMIWPLLGTAVHHVLDSAAPRGNVVTEERMFANVAGWVLSGQVDHQETEGGKVYISDYKVTSVWSVIYGKEDWVRQLNSYAYLARRNGKEVGGLRIIAVLRDWQRRDAMLKSDYPQTPVISIDIPLWPPERANEYVEERVHLHQSAQMIWDTKEAVVECNDEERWTKAHVWAVKKKGGKRSLKNFDNLKDAQKYAASIVQPTTTVAKPGSTRAPQYEIEFRAGGRTRCENYCAVADFCTQWIMEKVEAAAPELLGSKP